MGILLRGLPLLCEQALFQQPSIRVEQTELNAFDASKLGTSDDEIRLQFSLAGQD
jgi:hypothetical protein